ncbi:MAG: HAD-IC family P-type ATPase [Clostridia bacterium]|nr:HAD-IC family P-type ATPase [Clostridia bacterium]
MKKTNEPTGRKTTGKDTVSPIDKTVESEIKITRRIVENADEGTAREKTATPKKTAEREGAKAIAATKTQNKNATRERLGKIPKTVTKDTNDIAVTIDRSVFEGGEEKEDAAQKRSVTIDSTMLSQDRLRAQKKKKRRFVSTDYSLAERYEPEYTKGLTSFQVEKREADGYINVTKSRTGKSYGRIFISNIFTFFNLLIFVVAAALIAVGAGFNQLFFLVIAVANIAIGLGQEIKSKRTVAKLNLITAPSVLVIRDGEKRAVPVSEVVLDDVMYLEMGKQVPADAVVIKGDIEVNESMLTGESVPMRKKEGAELFSGSFVTSGTAYARVNQVGANNYVETLTSYAKKYRKPKSELNNSIRLIIRVVTVILIPLTVLMLLNAYKAYAGPADEKWKTIIGTTSGAVIGMIPAGMFLLTSSALAVSVMRLAKKKTLVQDLYCIEMLARVDVLCLDKTGTITDGSMQVNNVIEIKGGTQEYSLPDIIGSMLTATEDNNQTAMALANKFGYSQALRPKTVMPFSSQRKLSAVTFEEGGTYMLGAPEFVLKDMGVRIEKIVNENAANGYRVMVLAHSPAEIVGDKLPAVRRPVCLIVIEDHIRDDAVQTIKWFKENNVAVKVISGDNPVTVSEVARRVGVENAELYISLEGLSNQDVIEAANKYTVFGRVTPEQKCLLVKALKAKGHTVAMTGDGVNDILAMREADCSVAIASGSEAARNVSHLVLLDSNFTSMPDVVMEGRRVVNNIQKSSSLFLMKTFMSMALSIIFLILRKPYPFDTSNLLLLEMLVIGLPSFALAFQKNTDIIRGRFLSNVIGRCVPGGITLTLSVMAVYLYMRLGVSANITAGSAAYTSMLVLALTYTGMIVLYKNCEPFDIFRTVLIITVIVASVIAVIFFPAIFGVTDVAVADVFFITTVILAGYFIVSILMRIMRGAKLLQ